MGRGKELVETMCDAFYERRGQVLVKDTAPEWMADVIFEAHKTSFGTVMPPDDRRYVMIRKVAEALRDYVSYGGSLEDVKEDALLDGLIDVYNTSLLLWISSNLERANYADEVLMSDGYPPKRSFFQVLQEAQRLEYSDIFNAMRTKLLEVAKRLETV